jgi:hypothetical protein
MAARVECDRAPSPRGVERGEIEAILDYSGDVGAALNRATPEKLGEPYGALDLELICHPDDRSVAVRIDLRRG